MQNRTLTIAIIVLALSITTWIPGGLSDEGSGIDERIDATTLPQVSLRSLPGGAVTIALANGTIAPPVVPAAAPPGLSDLDPWVDANGDEMFGTLIMGTNAIQFNGRALSATTDGRIQFDGTDLCLASSNCAGVATAELPLQISDSTISLSTIGCGAGDVWKWTGSSWSCEEDVDTDTDTTYDGTDFALSDQACASGEVVASVDASGNVVCVVDQDTDTDTLGSLACAGEDITQFDGSSWVCSTDQVGITEETDPTVNDLAQASLACASGQVAKFDGSSWACSTDLDTDTTYDGTDFALSDQACAPDELVAGVDASGNIACVAVDASDSDTLASLSCAGDEITRFDGANWVCSLDQDTDTTYTAGTGLDLVGTEFSADTTVVQSRVTGMCDGGSSIRTIAQDGTVTCEFDDDTQYDGTDFALSDQSCSVDSFIRTIDATGGLSCADDQVDGGDADLLDGLDSQSFLRSDISATFTGGLLTVAPGADEGFDLRSNSLDDVDIRRDATDDSTDWFRLFSGGFEQLRLTDGDEAAANFDGAVNANGLDLAELYVASELLEPGDVVALDPSVTGGVVKSTAATAGDVIGVVSTDPGLVLTPHGIASEAELEEELGPKALTAYEAAKPRLVERVLEDHPALDLDQIPQERLDAMTLDAYVQEVYAEVALAGRVPTKVSAENGPIQPGDLLAPSSAPGVAAKADGPGPVIGRALEAYGGLPTEDGLIEVFISPDWTGAPDTALQDRVEELEQENQELTQRLDTLEALVQELMEDRESQS